MLCNGVVNFNQVVVDSLLSISFFLCYPLCVFGFLKFLSMGLDVDDDDLGFIFR